jgi:hypothetical protein
VQDELLAMPEWQRVARVQHFGMTVRLLERNARELTAALDTLTHDPRSFHLTSVPERAALNAALEEVLHLLHNFVAAALTLVDHTRVLHDELYAKGSLFPDYEEEKNNRFVTAPLIQFIKCLRQLTQHVRLPHVSFSVDFVQGGPFERKILLSKPDLLKWSGWNAAAQKHLGAAPDQIDLDGLVRAYLVAIREFYQWMQQRQAEIHGGDHAAIVRKQREGIELLAPMIPTLLETGLSIRARGVGDLSAVFAAALSERDWVELSQHKRDLKAWTDAAIAVVESRFGELPRELVERIRSLAAATKPSTARDGGEGSP